MGLRVSYVGGPLDGSEREFPALPPSHCHVPDDGAGVHYILFLAEIGDDTPVLVYVANGVPLETALGTLARRHAAAGATLTPAEAPAPSNTAADAPIGMRDAEPRPA